MTIPLTDTFSSVTQNQTYCYVVVAQWEDPVTLELRQLPSNEECLSTCDPPPCATPRISGWIFTDEGIIGNSDNLEGAFRIYEDPDDVPASPWSFPPSPGSLKLRMDFEDDDNCARYNRNIQHATAEAVITVAPGCPAQLTVDWCGMVEQRSSDYERMWLYVDGSEEASEQSTQGQDPSTCAPMLPVSGSQTIGLQPGFHLLRIQTDTGTDEKYHVDAFYEFEITLNPE